VGSKTDGDDAMDGNKKKILLAGIFTLAFSIYRLVSAGLTITQVLPSVITKEIAVIYVTQLQPWSMNIVINSSLGIKVKKYINWIAY
jgi:hypothetical protein